jgi:hypothetical protein
MSDDNIIIALAKLANWSDLELTQKGIWKGYAPRIQHPHKGHRHPLPNWINSIDAIIPLINAQSQDIKSLYADRLAWHLSMGIPLNYNDLYKISDAPARLRCVCLLQALGLYTEE